MTNPYDSLTPGAPEGNIYDSIPTTPPPAQQPGADVSLSLSDRGIDLVRGLVGGSRDAIQGMADLGLNAVEGLSTRVVDPLTGGNADVTRQAYAAIRSRLTFSEAEQNTTVLGEMTRQASKFLLGFGVAGKALKAVPAVAGMAEGGVAARLGQQAIQGVTADLLVADPHAQRLSDLVQAVPSLQNPVTAYLASDPEDSYAEGKLKTALEGAFVGTLVGGVFESIKALRTANALRAAGKAKEADKVLAKAGADAEQALQKAAGEDVVLSATAKQPMLPGLDEAITANVDKEALLARKTEREAGFYFSRKSAEEFKATYGTADEPVLHGTLNYGKIDSPDAVKNLLSDVVAVTKRDLPNVAGVVETQRETVEMARVLGRAPGDLMVSLKATSEGTEDLAARLIAGKGLIRKVSTDLYAVATKIENGIHSAEDLVTFSRMTDVLASTMDHVAGIQTAAARATAAGRIRITEAVTPGNLADLIERVGGGDHVKALAKKVRMAEGDPSGTVAALRSSPGTKALNIHNFVWINGVLGGVKTTVVNVGSTLVNTLLMPGYRMVGGVAQEILGNAEGREQVMRGWYQYRFLRHTFMDALDYAGRAWKSNSAILDASSSSMENLARMQPIQDATKGIESEAIRTGFRWLENGFGAPGRFLTMQDELFAQIAYRSHVMADAYVEGLSHGYAGKALDDFINTKVAQSFSETGRALDKTALGFAQAAKFTSDLKVASSIGSRTIGDIVNTAAASHPMLKGFLLPFTKVPTNLFRQAWDMTPGLNLLRAQVREDIRAGGERGAMALGKMGVGTMLWGAAGMLAYEGRITGGGPKDPQLRAQLGADWQPYSVLVSTNADGTRNYISFTRFAPFSLFFGIAADLAERGAHLDDVTKGQIAEKALYGLINNISNQTYLRGLTDAVNALADPDKAGTWLRSRAGSYVPGYVQLANMDDGLKDTRSMLDAVAARIPGWSASVETRRDNFGEKVTSPMGYPFNAINPFTFFRTSNDPARLALADLARSDAEARFALPNPIIAGTAAHGIDLRTIRNAQGQSAYDRWLELHSKLEIGGKTLHESMTDLVQSQEYRAARERMGQGSAVYRGSLATDMVRQRFAMYERLTRERLFQEFPGLRQAVMGFGVSKKVSKVDPQSSAVTPVQQLRDLAGQQ